MAERLYRLDLTHAQLEALITACEDRWIKNQSTVKTRGDAAIRENQQLSIIKARAENCINFGNQEARPTRPEK